MAFGNLVYLVSQTEKGSLYQNVVTLDKASSFPSVVPLMGNFLESSSFGGRLPLSEQVLHLTSD